MGYFDHDKYDLSDYDHARDHLIGLLDDIYKTGSVEDLEFHLDEICGFFGLRLPGDAPLLTKKQSTQEKQTEGLLKGWVDFTKTYAQKLAATTHKEEAR
jgi:hypothetical protein